MNGNDDWFAPKRFGFGAGRPIAWQGWALIATWAAAVIATMALLAPHHRALAVVMVVILSAPMLLISARHTRGGWKWRWGGEE